jgi:hypothetical protein
VLLKIGQFVNENRLKIEMIIFESVECFILEDLTRILLLHKIVETLGLEAKQII